MTVPEGYQKLVTHSPFVNQVGPFYFKETDSAVSFGLLIEDKHCNTEGSLHGGLIATMADLVLGRNAAVSMTSPDVIRRYREEGIDPAPGELPKLVTASLSVDYLGRARVGDWVEFRAEVDKTGKALTVVSATMYLDDEKITRANGSFRNLRH